MLPLRRGDRGLANPSKFQIHARVLDAPLRFGVGIVGHKHRPSTSPFDFQGEKSSQIGGVCEASTSDPRGRAKSFFRERINKLVGYFGEVQKLALH